MVGWPEKKRRAEKQRRNEAKKKEAEKREETRSKRSKSRILTLLMGKLSKITKIFNIPITILAKQLRKTLRGSRHFEDRPFQLRGATKSGKLQKLTSAKCRISETFVVPQQNQANRSTHSANPKKQKVGLNTKIEVGRKRVHDPLKNTRDSGRRVRIHCVFRVAVTQSRRPVKHNGF